MLKGNKSHDAFVAEMLLYFETTGITPQSNVMPPNIAAKEQASRVIEGKELRPSDAIRTRSWRSWSVSTR